MFDAKSYSKYVMLAFFFIVLVTSYFIVKPLLTAVLGSIVLAYIFSPLDRYLRRYVRWRSLSTLIVMLVIILIVTVPFFWFLNSLLKEVFVIYTIGEQRIVSGNLLGINCNVNPALCSKFSFMQNNLKLQYYTKEYLDKFKEILTTEINAFVFSIPHKLFGLIISLFMAFFLIRDGEQIFNRSRAIFTLKEHHEKSLMKQFNETIYAVIYGNLIIAVMAGVFGAIGFWLFDIPSPLFWGIVIALLALLPLIGGGIIWFVASVSLFLNGQIWSAVLLCIYGSIFISGMEFFWKPKIIGDRSKVHPIFVIAGVLGGISLFGFIGFIIGPVILALLVTFFELIEQERIIIDIKKG